MIVQLQRQLQRSVDRSNPVELALLLRRRKKLDVIRVVVGIVHL